jgi:tetratricopeptide (TPR) repeat protein
MEKAEAEQTRTCQVCRSKLMVNSFREFCPVCLLRAALTPAFESSLGSMRKASRPSRIPRRPLRFEHYEVLKGEDGKPVELGRGGMGITYRAFDIDLRCPVTLKVINQRYVGDESARLRFVREARAAASVRHPNVASVFHLGRRRRDYFYAMEFVEGETLEKLIKRSGRLEVKLALEILTQVAGGLAAVHEQNLVHRDIKPSNIMVRLKDDGGVTAKIIDLGLAKMIIEPSLETKISTPGAFVGTPEFASPEQFAGLALDTRSDLYSLGVTLWEMLTGRTPFRGSASEVMYQHQHTPLPLEELEGIPQPLILLIEVLLEKDPVRRFQNPAELLKAIPAIAGRIGGGATLTRQNLQHTVPQISWVGTRKLSTRVGPKKISVARLPVTGVDVFGREEDIAFLDAAWAKPQVNVVTIVAWAGVGKSTLVNHWLRQMAAEQYRSAQVVFGWSFYSSSADEFVDAALAWFGDPDPRMGTAWEKGERLAKLIARRRTLLVLDGLELLQNPPGPQEGRIREPSVQALLRELAAFNRGLCVITTRLPVADIADHERTSAQRRDLEQLSSGAGARLLRALGVNGSEAELLGASDEFSGHSLALTLLGSYLTDAYNGDIRYRKEVSKRLAQDVRQGGHARKVMESYQTWFGEGPELSILRMLGLFDRPADEKALGALLKAPAISGLTESLTDLSPTEWRTILARLRRAKLVAGEDRHNPGYLDMHPLVREYFGEQLQKERSEAWKECNKRLYDYYQALAPPLPDSFKDMEPLFLAVICGCNARLFRQALHEVYLPRIQRGNVFFAANVLGARGALLSVLAHFFEQRRWDSPMGMGIEKQNLTAEDQLFILMQAGLYLTSTRGMGSPEARICYERAEPLCNSLNRPQLLYGALMGQWRYSLMNDKLSSTMQIAKRIHSLAQEQKESALMIGAYRVLGGTLFFSGDFEAARKCAMRGVEIWRSGGAPSHSEFLDAPAVVCLCYEALSDWHFGETASCQGAIAEAISLAKELNDPNALALALHFSAYIAHYNRKAAEVERLASDLTELSTRHHFALWQGTGAIFRGWARSVSGSTTEGISWLEEGIADFRATGAMLAVPYWLALKAEALYLAERTSEALEAITEAEAVSKTSEERDWFPELHRLRGVFLTVIGADETQIESSYCAAIRTAKEQRSASLAKRAEGTYAEYRRQKGSASGRQQFRLPLC